MRSEEERSGAERCWKEASVSGLLSVGHLHTVQVVLALHTPVRHRPGPGGSGPGSSSSSGDVSSQQRGTQATISEALGAAASEENVQNPDPHHVVVLMMMAATQVQNPSIRFWRGQ